MRNIITLKVVIITCLALIIFSGCASYKFSNKSKEEVLLSELTDTSKVIVTSNLIAQSTRGEVDMIGRIIGYAASGIKNLIALNKKKLTAEYKTGIDNLYFYDAPSTRGITDPNGMRFNGFKVLRTFKEKDKVDTALFLCFSVDTSNKSEIINNSIFRLKLDEIKVNYAKVRIPGFKWYMPWTVFWAGKKNKKLNMDIEIIITSSWLNENYNINRDVKIGRYMLCLREMPLDINDTSYVNYYFKLKGKILDGFSFIVPRSLGYYPDVLHKLNKCWGQGIFNIQVNVLETGKEKYITKIDDKSPAVIDEMHSIIKEFRKKD